MRAASLLTLLSLSLGAFFLRSAAPLPTVDTPIHQSVRHSDVASGTIARALAIVTAPLTAPDDDRDDIIRRVRDGEAGTYIGDILRLRDSSLARWPDRNEKPLTVWIQSRSAVKDYTTNYVASEIPVEQRAPILAVYRPLAGKVVEGYWRQLPNNADHPVFALTLKG